MRSIEHVEEYKGLMVAVAATGMGHRCGYVGVPEGHPLHGMHYDEVDKKVGVYVHGGLTYSGRWGDDGLWYLGFDCAHFGDAPDPELVSDEWMRFAERRFGDGHVWTCEEVAAECKALAESILARYH